MFKKYICASLFVLVLVISLQSVSAYDADFDANYADDFNLEDSQILSSTHLSDSTYESDIIANGYGDDGEILSDEDDGEVILEDGEIDDSFPTDSENGGEDNRNLTKIASEPIEFDYGSQGELSINLTDDNGIGLYNKTISVNINDNCSNLSTDENGIAIFKYSGAAGIYDVKISFSGDDTYAPSNITTKISIAKSSTNLKVPNVRSYLTCSTYVLVTLTDSKGHTLVYKNIYVVISGTTYNATTNSKGIAKIKVPTKVGNYTVSIRFKGDENYTASSSESKVVITKMKTSLIVPVVKSYMTKSTYLKITLKNIFGVALANKRVSIAVGKKTYYKTTNAKGIAKLKFTTKIRTVKCTVRFCETNTYFASSNSSKVIITKMPTCIKAPKVTFNSTVYGKLRINLTDMYGKALRNKVLSVRIPALKKVFKVKTNDKGVAVLKFNGPKTYNVTVRFAGNKNYAAKSVKSQFVVRKVKVKFNDVIGAAEVLKDYISEKKSLPSRIKYKNHTFTTAELSYLMAVSIKHIKSKNKNDIVLIAVSAPSKSSGEIYDTVYKKDYLKIANKAVGSSTNHKTPKYVKYSFYKVPYKVYTASFSRILTFYKENKKLPNYSLFTNSEYAKVSNSSKYTFYLTTDNIAGKKSDLKMLKRLKKALKSKGYQAIIIGIGPDIHNKAYRYGCTGKKSVLLCCFGGVDVGCIEEWAGELSVGDGNFVKNYKGAHVLGLWYSKPYGASASLKKPIGRAWDADYGFGLKNPAKYMSNHKISYIETGTVSSACTLLKSGKMGGPKLIR